MNSQKRKSTAGDRKIAAVYARKSDDDDAGIQTQIKMNVRAAEDDGFTVPEGVNFRFADNEVSGTTSTRQGLDRLIELVLSSRTPFSRVYVRDVTRWGRWDDPRERYYFEKLLERNGVRIRYLKGVNVELDDGVEADDIGHLLHDFIETVFASKERRETRWRSRTGKRARFIAGYWPFGPAPYGTERWLADAETRELIAPVRPGQTVERANCHYRLNWADDGSKQVVARIFRWVDEENLSYREIAQRLTQADVTPPSGDPAASWNGTTVRQIARRPIYRGDAVFGRTVSDDDPVPAEDAKAEPEDNRPILYREFMPDDPPVSRDRYQRVQKIANKREEKNPGPPADPKYLLSGLLECGHCGAPWSGMADTDPSRHYYRHSYRHECPDTNTTYIRTSTVDDAVFSQVLKGIDNDDLNCRIRDKLNRLRGSDRAEKRSREINSLEQQIDQDRAALERAFEQAAFASTEEALQAHQNVVQKTEQRLKTQKKELENLRQEEQRLERLADRRSRLATKFDDKAALLRSASDQRRKEILRTLLDHIEIYPDESRLVISSRAL